ncbi:MAG TPA: four helix bundle protein [Saprospiraceae bacterium]|nr:four helix bundle protein [Saprospiraceae bacterium]
MKPKFRFQDLEIWKEAIEIGLVLFDIADRLEHQKLFRFVDQIRGVGMSISNNIAESSGADYVGEERKLLRVSRRECFEGANILILLERKGLLFAEELDPILIRLDILSRRINKYIDSLK